MTMHKIPLPPLLIAVADRTHPLLIGFFKIWHLCCGSWSLRCPSLMTAPGHDEITYSMLRHLNSLYKGVLLQLYNEIWMTGIFPRSWKECILIPLLKPGKDPTDCSSYCSISRTSCVGKTLKLIVNRSSRAGTY